MPKTSVKFKNKTKGIYYMLMNALYFNVSDNESELEDIRNGLKIWDKYIQGLKTELLILVPTASEKSTARTNLENKRSLVLIIILTYVSNLHIFIVKYKALSNPILRIFLSNLSQRCPSSCRSNISVHFSNRRKILGFTSQLKNHLRQSIERNWK